MALPRLSPAAYRRTTLAALLLLGFIVVTGAAVRLTGSGLGCPTWPECSEGSLVPRSASDTHALIEFVNRAITGVVSLAVMAAVLGSLIRSPRRTDLTRLSLGLVAGVIGQIVLGGITVLVHLHPAAVGSHFVLSMVLVWNAVVLHHRAGQPDGPAVPLVSPGARRLVRLVLVAAAVVVCTGVVVTGSGPHAGDERAVRWPFAVADVARVHGVAVWLFLVTTVLAIRRLSAEGAPEAARRRLRTLVAVSVAQAGVGYAQYVTGVPVLLVAVHVLGAVTVWTAAVRAQLGLVERLPEGAQAPAADGDAAPADGGDAGLVPAPA